jgi:hypothetical protein
MRCKAIAAAWKEKSLELYFRNLRNFFNGTKGIAIFYNGLEVKEISLAYLCVNNFECIFLFFSPVIPACYGWGSGRVGPKGEGAWHHGGRRVCDTELSLLDQYQI